MTTDTPRTDAMWSGKRSLYEFARTLERELNACYDRRLFLSDEVTAQAETIARLEERIKGYEAWERGVNEALNRGDGSYRP